MSKYDKLWDYVAAQPGDALDLSFDEIGEIAGVALDHSFLNFKKELLPLGCLLYTSRESWLLQSSRKRRAKTLCVHFTRLTDATSTLPGHP